MTTLEERVSRLEGVVEQVNERLAAFQGEMRSLRQDMQEEMRSMRQDMHAEMREMRAQQGQHFRWLMGVVLVQWVTVLAAVLGALLTR